MHTCNTSSGKTEGKIWNVLLDRGKNTFCAYCWKQIKDEDIKEHILRKVNLERKWKNARQ